MIPVPSKQPVRLPVKWRAQIDDYVIALSWSHGGKCLAVASVSGPIYVFDGVAGTLLATLPGHKPGTAALSWRATHQELASSGQDGKIRLWDSDTFQERAVLDGGGAWVEHLAWSPSGHFLASAAGRTLRLWNAQGERVREFEDHPSTIADLAWKPGVDELGSVAYGVVNFWNPAAVVPIRSFHWKGSMLALAWSPNGAYLATGNQDATVHFWIMRTGEDLQMSGYANKIRELAWDSRSRYLAMGGRGAVSVWDCSGDGPAGTTPIVLRLHETPIEQLAYQHKGKLLASGCGKGLIALWQPGKHKAPLGIAAMPGGISQLRWSPDDGLLAAGDGLGGVCVFQSPKT